MKYLSVLLKLLPLGRAFRKDKESFVYKLLNGVGKEFERIELDAKQLLTESNPATTDAFLEDWERVVKIPDEIQSKAVSTVQRREDVVRKMRARGGSSAPYFEGRAADLGYDVDVQDYAPLVAGFSAGDSCFQEAWRFFFLVKAMAAKATYFSVGSSAGEPLAIYGDTVLEKYFKKYAPAHTTPVFSYGSIEE